MTRKKDCIKQAYSDAVVALEVSNKNVEEGSREQHGPAIMGYVSLTSPMSEIIEIA